MKFTEICGNPLSLAISKLVSTDSNEVVKVPVGGMLTVLRRKDLASALRLVINKNVLEDVLNGTTLIEEINDPSGVCVERARSLSEWFAGIAARAINAWNARGKVTTEQLITNVTKEYLPRICSVISSLYLKKAILYALKKYVISSAKERGITTSEFIKISLNNPLPPSVAEDAVELFKEFNEQMGRTVVTTLNLVVWLHLSPGRALLLSSYFKDVKGEAWSLDILAETIGFMVWKYLGVCTPKEGLPLVILGASGKRAFDTARIDYAFTPDIEELFEFISKYYEMNFPCASKSKRSEGVMKLAKEMITPTMGPIEPIIEDKHVIPIERFENNFPSTSYIYFSRPICGTMPSYIARLKTKSKEKVAKMVGSEELKRAIEEIPAERIYYAMAYKSYRRASPKERAEVKKRVANADVNGLRPTQAESLLALLETIALYNGAILKARTGWGKTVVAAKLLENAITKGKILFGREIRKTFFVTKAALVEQAAEEIFSRCRECEGKVTVVSYDALYSAIRELEESVGARLTRRELYEAVTRVSKYAGEILAKEGFKGLVRKGVTPAIYEAIAEKLIDEKPPFKYQFAVRVISDEWIRALAYGEAVEEVEHEGVSLVDFKADLLKEFEEADLIVFDEVHELRQLSKLRLLEVNTKAIRVGLSATPQHLYSAENVELLKTAIGPIVIGKEEEVLAITSDEAEEEMGREIIVKKFSAPNINTRNVDEYWEALLEAIRNSEEVLKVLKDPSNKVLILTRYVKGIEKFIEGLRELGIEAIAIDGKSMSIEEAKKYADVECLRRSGTRRVDKKAVAKCMKRGVYVATEAKLGVGWNDPQLDVLVLANSMLKRDRSVPRLIQVIGRSMRFAPRKYKKLVLLACPESKSKRYFTCDEELVRETIERELKSYRG